MEICRVIDIFWQSSLIGCLLLLLVNRYIRSLKYGKEASKKKLGIKHFSWSAAYYSIEGYREEAIKKDKPWIFLLVFSFVVRIVSYIWCW
jgi:hypothetical protein